MYTELICMALKQEPDIKEQMLTMIINKDGLQLKNIPVISIL